MNILVTGGVGYIGSCLLSMLRDEEFMDDGVIRSLDNNSGKEHLKVKRTFDGDKRYQLIKGDIRRRDDVKKSLNDIEAVVHLAAVSGFEACTNNTHEAILTNIYGTQTILEAAENSNVERIIFASSAAVYGNPEKYPIIEEERLKPLNLYGVTKVVGEQLTKIYNNDYGLCTTILRLSNVYGLGIYACWNTVAHLFVKAATEGKPMIIYGSGKQARNFVHVRDVSNAIIECLKAEEKNIRGEVFNIGGWENININELAHQVRHLVKKEKRKSTAVIHAPPRSEETYAMNFQYSIGRAKQVLGYNPHFDLKKGILELINHDRNTKI
ncbi:MAG: NAD-dependent epimerase/dehydratase family protein [Candidatus Hodarchaeota archaeon]